MKTSDKVLLALGLFLLAFITCMVVTFWRFQSVPDALIQYTLGAGGVEALVMNVSTASGTPRTISTKRSGTSPPTNDTARITRSLKTM